MDNVLGLSEMKDVNENDVFTIRIYLSKKSS